jgi:hypothetical protein
MTENKPNNIVYKITTKLQKYLILGLYKTEFLHK